MLALTIATMAWIIGACLALYLGVIIYAINAPQKQHDPHRGVAVGCLMIAAIPAIVMAILLAVGVIGGFEGLVRVLFYFTVLPAGYVLAMLAAQPIFRWYRNRNTWQPTIAGEAQGEDSPDAGADDAR